MKLWSKFFRRRIANGVGGSEKAVTFPKIFESLNYGPLPYKFSNDFLTYCAKAPREFEIDVNKTDIDDLNYDIFTPSIDAHVNSELISAKEQFTYHIGTIEHHCGLIKGAFAAAEMHLNDLEKDKQNLESKLQKLMAKKEALEGGNYDEA